MNESKIEDEDQDIPKLVISGDECDTPCRQIRKRIPNCGICILAMLIERFLVR
jgi:hypothetical protein